MGATAASQRQRQPQRSTTSLRSGRTFDFIGRSRTWLFVSLGLLALCLLALLVQGLRFGIDFTGGSAFVVTGATRDFTAEQLSDAIAAEGVTEVAVQIADGDAGRGALIRVPSLEEVGGAQQAALVGVIAEVTGAPEDDVDVSAVGPRWGAQVSRQALQGLAVFLVLVVAYISFRFEWRMAVAALVTLAHDILVTVGIYALVGFEVTPASVIALLTILGYSLYDTIIVFDRVQENAARMTSVSSESYGQVANTSLNQVLIRSLSTALAALLPVGSLLFIGSSLLGADTLRDLALALFVGMAVGAYSSIFVATPFLVWLKERDPRLARLAERAGPRAR